MKCSYRRILLVAGTVFLSALLSACGGGGGSGNSSDPTTSVDPPEEFSNYRLSLIAVEAMDRNTAQSIGIEGLPLEGNTALAD